MALTTMRMSSTDALPTANIPVLFFGSVSLADVVPPPKWKGHCETVEWK